MNGIERGIISSKENVAEVLEGSLFNEKDNKKEKGQATNWHGG